MAPRKAKAPNTKTKTKTPGVAPAAPPAPAPEATRLSKAGRSDGMAKARPQRPRRKPAAAELPPEEFRRLVAEAAYYRAEKRGFAPGYEMEDWISAEAEVKGRIQAAGNA